MKLKLIVSVCLVAFATTFCIKRRKADRILAIIYHTDGQKVICQSHLRPDLSDNVPTLREVILKELILLDAKALKVPVTDTEVDRHLANVQDRLKMTRDDLTDFFKKRGLTFEEGRKELEKNLLMEITIEQRVKSKAFVAKSEIDKEYNDNPIWRYQIKQTTVPFNGGSKALQLAVIDRDIESGDIFTSAEWEGPVTLHDSDFADEKAYIKDLKAGSVTKVNETESGVALLHLVSKERVPLEELKAQITNKLGRDRQMAALNNYYESLLKSDKRPLNAQIKYIDENQALS